jgi:ubiquinone/menaquinone biosynthesis C-methylase UbiE
VPGASENAAAPTLHLAFDPAQPLLAHNTLEIAGWALSPAGVESVKVRIGGREMTASFGLASPDWLEEPPDWPGARFPGFRLAVDTSAWPRGRHHFAIDAVDRAGASVRVEASAVLEPYAAAQYSEGEALAAFGAGEPAMLCEAPNLFQPRDMPYREVAGWAASRAGIAAVLLTIDGRRRLEVPHGLARPDLRDRLGEETAAEAGFSIQLDEEELPLGWHQLTLVVVDGAGRALGASGLVNRVPDLPAAGSDHGDRDEQEESLDDSGERFDPAMHLDNVLAPEHYARYRWAAEQVEGMNVLDAGCGVGWGTALLAGRARAATGLDIAAIALAEAERRHGSQASFRQGDLYRLPFPRDHFDAVVSFEAIEHVEEPERALDEMRRVLRPGGLLLVSSPNRGVYVDDNPFHLHELTAAELEEALRSRFANVAIHRQQTYFASALLDERGLRADDPEAALEAEVVKLGAHPPGAELYTVAAASDGELPRAPMQLVLGAGADYRGARDLVAMWQARSVRAEAETTAMEVEKHFQLRRQRATISDLGKAYGPDPQAALAALEARHAELRRQLSEERRGTRTILESTSWRLTGPLRRRLGYRGRDRG